MRIRMVCWVFVCCSLLIAASVVLFGDATKHTELRAAVPRGKTSRGFRNLFSNSFMSNLVREIKSSFSSEFERLFLQATKPNDGAVAEDMLEDISQLVNLEHAESAQFLVMFLVKISRKFAEENVFTQCKALYLLHDVLHRSGKKAQNQWRKAIAAMRAETDEKIGRAFFSLDAIDESQRSAGTVLEMRFLEMNRHYAPYVFDVIETDWEAELSPQSTAELSKIKLLLDQIERGNEIARLANELDTPLSKQCGAALAKDREHMLALLSNLYNANKMITDPILDRKAEDLLSAMLPEFKPRPPVLVAPPSPSPKQIKETVDTASDKKLADKKALANEKVKLEKQKNEVKQKTSPVSPDVRSSGKADQTAKSMKDKPRSPAADIPIPDHIKKSLEKSVNNSPPKSTTTTPHQTVETATKKASKQIQQKAAPKMEEKTASKVNKKFIKPKTSKR